MLRPLSLRRYLRVMHNRGFTAEQVLFGSGVAAAEVDDPKTLLEVDQYRGIIENIIHLADGNGIGLDVGQACDVKDLGILGYASLSCQTVRHAVEELWGKNDGLGSLFGIMSLPTLKAIDADAIAAEFSAAAASPMVHRFVVEEALCVLRFVGFQVSGLAPQFRQVEVDYPRPTYGQRYREIFGCPVVFDAPETRIVFARKWFESPLKTSDGELLSLYKKHLAELRGQIHRDESLEHQLRTMFVSCPGRMPTLEKAASMLGLSARTLRRRVEQRYGKTYRQFVEDYRKAQALQRLKSSAATAKRVGCELGYADVNAFRRAFKTWTGMTITEYQSREGANRARI